MRLTVGRPEWHTPMVPQVTKKEALGIAESKVLLEYVLRLLSLSVSVCHSV